MLKVFKDMNEAVKELEKARSEAEKVFLDRFDLIETISFGEIGIHLTMKDGSPYLLCSWETAVNSNGCPTAPVDASDDELLKFIKISKKCKIQAQEILDFYRENVITKMDLKGDTEE